MNVNRWWRYENKIQFHLIQPLKAYLIAIVHLDNVNIIDQLIFFTRNVVVVVVAATISSMAHGISSSSSSGTGTQAQRVSRSLI